MVHTKTSTTDTNSLISLANGRCAYVFGENGRSAHLNTGSPAFIEAIASLAARGQSKRLRAQIDKLCGSSDLLTSSNWRRVSADLDDAGVLA